MKDSKVWVRVGNGDDYHDFKTPYEAGNYIGQFTADRKPRHNDLGVSLDGFEGQNYISLFWGDDDAHPLNQGLDCAAMLNPSDKLDFKQGLNEAECYTVAEGEYK